MATKLILLLALVFCLLITVQVSSDPKKNEEKTSTTMQVVSRGGGGGGYRELLQSFEYFKAGLVSPPAKAPAVAPAPSPSHAHPAECGKLCDHRCSLHSRRNTCVRACGTCCVRCKCVPPGTFGNREACGKCYTDMTTHGNKTKCP